MHHSQVQKPGVNFAFTWRQRLAKEHFRRAKAGKLPESFGFDPKFVGWFRGSLMLFKRHWR